jgi:isoleucyl-tRNA synthetase
VVLDTRLTDELRAEGLARDLLRSIQQLRKQAGLEPGAQASVAIGGTHALLEELKTHVPAIERSATVTIEWRAGESDQTVEVDGLVVTLLKTTNK